MARVLFTFLGRGVSERGESGYRLATYDLPAYREEVTYFAFALIADRVRRGVGYDRVVVLGTAGSMWDDLAATLGGRPSDDPAVAALRDAAKRSQVDAPRLDRLGRDLSSLGGMSIECLLIPDCRTEREAMGVAALIAGRVGTGDVVEFDVTHSYRHLPLLALSALSLVGPLRRATIEAVHYGAFDMGRRGEPTPVLDLSGYLRLIEWTQALAAFDASGDPTRLGRLIEEDTGAKVADEIAAAAHRERMLDVDAVLGPWRKARVALNAAEGIGALFREPLARRFGWAEERRLSRRQLRLSRQACRQGDTMRAVLLLLEAAQSDEVERRGGAGPEVKQRDRRDEAHEALLRRSAYRELNKLRIAFAHPAGGRDVAARTELATPAEAAAALQRLDAALFADERSTATAR